ncbi:H-NS family nucleoid-associated regulatory protein [Burkholderia multivorans]|uniref:H-NS family nucleoid-associated regulatory protein n=1 Tax=Burkholderia multivorans TaxID=87883 RepID=UPI001C25B398|nr:H-NS family nucleoid-associated regulatory protein [Burkholderia multivorans]MBU9526157.1 H-NS histone family protein [Burkholderia multivorans]
MASKLAELLEKQAALAAQIEAAREAEREDGLAKVVELADQLGERFAADVVKTLTTRFHLTTKKGSKAPTNAKYRDPASGKTWSGKGRKPSWMIGHDDEYLIQQEAPQEAPKSRNRRAKATEASE